MIWALGFEITTETYKRSTTNTSTFIKSKFCNVTRSETFGGKQCHCQLSCDIQAANICARCRTRSIQQVILRACYIMTSYSLYMFKKTCWLKRLEYPWCYPRVFVAGSQMKSCESKFISVIQHVLATREKLHTMQCAIFSCDMKRCLFVYITINLEIVLHFPLY